MSQTIINDISFWQETADFEVMKTKTAGVILRAGQGSWEDKRFQEFRRDATGVIPFGTYWYYDNNHHPKRQAEQYAGIIEGNVGTLGAWLDLEHESPAPYKSYKFWYDFCEYFKQLLPKVQLGIYTRTSYFNPLVPVNEKYFGQYPLWIAQYKTLKPDIPHNWTDWLLWQYTDSGDGHAHGVGSKEIDMNYYKGGIIPPIENKGKIVASFGNVKVEYEEV